MELGFQTIGNATLIAYDCGPVLTTDPWLTGSAYFGSWALSHAIPIEQIEAIKSCPYVFISHGHPDHLSMESLAFLTDKTLLLPDHVGGRIKHDLIELGYRVVVLTDGKWERLSDRIHVMGIADWNQDGLLLIDIGGTLVLNFNDGSGIAWRGFLTKLAKSYRKTFLLRLFGYGDADMMNFVDEEGRRLEPPGAQRCALGHCIQLWAEQSYVTDVIPFSSFHKYQRLDSVWANQYAARPEDFVRGFASTRCRLHPPFVSYDCGKDELHEIRPESTSDAVFSPEAFGDNWTDALDTDEVKIVSRYFRSIQHLEKVLDFITIRVGGREHQIQYKKRGSDKKGIIFEVPRHSLMHAIGYECFDDLLIGNFMRTRLVGNWPGTQLYPDFSPYVAKYRDNGRAKTDEELKYYFGEYRKRAGTAQYLRAVLAHEAGHLRERFVRSESPLYYAARGIKRFIVGPRVRSKERVGTREPVI